MKSITLTDAEARMIAEIIERRFFDLNILAHRNNDNALLAEALAFSSLKNRFNECFDLNMKKTDQAEQLLAMLRFRLVAIKAVLLLIVVLVMADLAYLGLINTWFLLGFGLAVFPYSVNIVLALFRYASAESLVDLVNFKIGPKQVD